MQSDIYSIVSTVRVKSETAPGGHLVINESDFDPAVHELFTRTVLPPPPKLPEPPKEVHPALANLPKTWRNEKSQWLCRIAEKVSGRTPETREQAIAIIESNLNGS